MSDMQVETLATICFYAVAFGGLFLAACLLGWVIDHVLTPIYRTVKRIVDRDAERRQWRQARRLATQLRKLS